MRKTMKIAVTAMDSHLGAGMAENPETCSHFLFFENENPEIGQVTTNPYRIKLNGADIFCAQILICYGITVLITGKCSGNSLNLLQAANIQVIYTAEKTVEKALRSYQKILHTTL
jgi:predicted Fe-Mo cluster-binding NifX family protein